MSYVSAEDGDEQVALASFEATHPTKRRRCQELRADGCRVVWKDILLVEGEMRSETLTRVVEGEDDDAVWLEKANVETQEIAKVLEVILELIVV